ncbi:uncharacterized protein FOMMEDRAFT_123160 [Fomitiporia mediterranea MF3/22]|uniref:uncharacterized protein n=1 Tax=Fomitiporia mediterranea (strain MF3/22) TaxID=694068 RepID=UPI0004409894|nr:uncharacterized protein FOMMEDRAFT_123160 [Fomitiporia mediterranea MF3/22]EJD03013.1 hypothetical protein FOMMEDRAFT_123160 [Fomitiporia mediterranea MF3/22]
MVQWRLPQYKKHKTWDGDGVLVLFGGKGVLYGMDGTVATGKPNPDGACIGTFLQLGGKEMEIDCELPKLDFTSGKVFGKGSFGSFAEEMDTKPNHASALSLKKKFSIPLKSIPVKPAQQPQSSDTSDPLRTRGIDLEPVCLLQRRENELPPNPIPNTYWSAHWRRPQGRKHKTWDGDSFVVCSGNKLTMVSDDGKLMGTTKWRGGSLQEGCVLQIASRTVELESRVVAGAVPRITGTMTSERPCDEDSGDLETPLTDDACSDAGAFEMRVLSFAAKENIDCRGTTVQSISSEATRKKFVTPVSFYGQAISKSKPATPLHDPLAEGAVVMKEPTKEHQRKFNLKGRPVIPVVVDPILARHLRPHQKEGVKFMYECVMGLRKHEGQGCILADEMGMGKTLQTITLVWTLLKQNCYAGTPAVGKVMIVCPVTLIANWKKEFHKWLGKDRLGIFTGDKNKEAVKQFINSKIHQVLIIGYEKLRTVISELAYCLPPIGLIICDEGHRLKSSNNKTSTMFEALSTPRRIILSGTPIQNDLSEFHAMADFCNPGLLDDYSIFRKVFENAILKSRTPDCSAKEREIGEGRQAQLQTVARSFVLRREASILTNYLPPKYEYVVFVTPSPLQRQMFVKILQPDTLATVLHGSMARSLAMIQLLTKLSNSPILLKAALEKREDKAESDAHEAFDEAVKLLPECARAQDPALSGKLQALSNLLAYLRKETDEKCILVSHYTSTLDVIEEFCKEKKYTFLRLDGQTPVAKRQEYVDRFNKAPQSGAFLFLLSAKAGGVGLNLIGASRLCLIDSDWNPSHDLQSMARIHRDGQKRPVFIYRLLTAGTIDEKIYQRQITKLALSASLMGKDAPDSGSSKSDSFTQKELRDLFTFYQHTSCHTHDLIGCPCTRGHDEERSDDPMLDDAFPDLCFEESDNEEQTREIGFCKASLIPEDYAKLDKAFLKKKKAELASLGEWTHINCLDARTKPAIIDKALQSISSVPSEHNVALDRETTAHILPEDIPGGSISFLFERTSEKSV